MLSQVNIPYGAFQAIMDDKMKVNDVGKIDMNGNSDTVDDNCDVDHVSEEGDSETETTCDCGRSRMREDLDICVCNPTTDKYTTYEIKIQTVNPAFNLRCSHTRRRYNDFCWLRKMLKKHHPMSMCPDLPSKKMFSERFEPQFLVERMKSLEDWLFRMLEVDLFLSDTTVHLFLQTNLSCSQIESYVNGRLSSAIVRQAYRACKLQSEHSFMRSMSKSPSERQEPTHPIQVLKTERSKSRQCDKQTDSGVIVSDSSDNDSSYESQSGYSSSSEMNVTFPNLTEVTIQSKEHKQTMLDESQDLTNVQDSLSVKPSHESSSSLKIASRQNSTTSRRREGTQKRVEMGVIFSINSV